MRSWQVFAAIALLVAALAVAGWLLTRSASPPATGVSQTAQAGDLNVTVRVDEAAVGARIVDVTVSDAFGKPADVGAVRLRFSMTDMDMGSAEVDAQRIGAGRFQARGPFFTMAGSWRVEATVLRDGQPPAQAPFTLAVAAPGEAGGPLNPLKPDAQTVLAGQKLYLANCATCHGQTGRGDGPAAVGLSPRPGDFTQHMQPGKHTDGQSYLWIKNGYPGSAMPAWEQRLSEEQIWQLVSYLRTFGQSVAQTQPSAGPATTPPAQPGRQPTAQVPSAQEPLPPIVFVRQGNIWRSDGKGGAPQPITKLEEDSYAEYPTFSPDGARVAFIQVSPAPPTATLPLPGSTLYMINADGSGLRAIWKLAQGQLGIPAWTPDAQALYIAANSLQQAPDGQAQGGRRLQVVRLDLATGAQQPLVDDALDPALSRDGRQLAYLKLSDDGYIMSLMVAAPDGSGEKMLIDGKDFESFYAPRFAPDGKRIVVAGIGGPQTDKEGRPVKSSAPSLLGRLAGLFAPPTAEAHGQPWDLWEVNTDGGGLRRMTTFNEDLPMAAFSPDGRQIAVMALGGIYLMDPDGAHLRRIDPAGDHGGLDWAPR